MLMRWIVILAGSIVVGFLSVLWIGACRKTDDGSSPSPIDSDQVQRPAEQAHAIRFRDVAKDVGVAFRHDDGRTPMHYFPEAMGSGVAWLDYDLDGYPDLLFVQGGKFPPDSKSPATQPTTRLYRNQGDGTFVDVTEKVGPLVTGFGQGVAVGDYDNDGYPDLFVSCYGHGRLFHNEPDGRGGRRFRDVTRAAGIELDGWCSSCAFGDVHGNGYLDLFVCRYVHMDLQRYPFCGDKTRDPPLRITCGPREFPGTRSVLYRNNGDGTFTDVSASAGIEGEGKGLGVVIVDLDSDGRSDIFVGNDEMPNFQYRNLGGGKLQSCGIVSGTAVNWQGRPMGSMGVEADDFTGHGRPDVFITTFFHQGWTLYRNEGGNLFTDVSPRAGMHIASWDKVGWGTCPLDADLDGALDIFVANGHIYRNAEEMPDRDDQGKPLRFAQLPQFFRGDGRGAFRDISADAGDYFRRPHAGRGVAMADYDNDGAMDIAINHCGEPAGLLHNETRSTHHWIRLQLEGARHLRSGASNRDAVGARVTVRAGGRTLVRYVKGGGSYLSAHDRRLLIGLGDADRVDEVEVRWPNAQASTQRFGPLPASRSYKLVEGAATAAPANAPPARRP
jgi:enediyne biosynthesis protein E4